MNGGTLSSIVNDSPYVATGTSAGIPPGRFDGGDRDGPHGVIRCDGNFGPGQDGKGDIS